MKFFSENETVNSTDVVAEGISRRSFFKTSLGCRRHYCRRTQRILRDGIGVEHPVRRRNHERGIDQGRHRHSDRRENCRGARRNHLHQHYAIARFFHAHPGRRSGLPLWRPPGRDVPLCSWNNPSPASRRLTPTFFYPPKMFSDPLDHPEYAGYAGRRLHCRLSGRRAQLQHTGSPRDLRAHHGNQSDHRTLARVLGGDVPPRRRPFHPAHRHRRA